jgi:hypothetical protein
VKERWSIDFVSDQLANDRRFRVFNVVDDFLVLWAQRRGVKLHFIQPGMPMQNAFVESFNSFNGKFREYCLDLNWFMSLEDARLRIERRREHYTHVRPHRSLGKRPPAVFAAGVAAKRQSGFRKSRWSRDRRPARRPLPPIVRHDIFRFPTSAVGKRKANGRGSKNGGTVTPDQAALAHRARLPGTEAGAWAGSLRRTQLARLPPPRDTDDRRVRISDASPTHGTLEKNAPMRAADLPLRRPPRPKKLHPTRICPCVLNVIPLTQSAVCASRSQRFSCVCYLSARAVGDARTPLLW